MTVKFISDGCRLTASLYGELDHHEANETLKAVSDEIDSVLPRDLTVDMGGVGFMDSSGIAVALRLYKKVGYIGGRLRIENVRTQPMHVFDAAGIDRIISISGSTREE